jgi:1,2-dihydroxy-3-keto-5-methylthiopentene dioxygenase
MTTMTVFEEAGRAAPIEATDDIDDIQARLAVWGIGFERFSATVALPATADEEFVLQAYGATIDRLVVAGGFRSADVFRLLPDAWDRGEVREKYLIEHTHDDDEVRFFVEGGGTFYLRAEGRVVELRVERGDLVRVPAGARHWFDAGDPPFCTAIRLFTRADGWVGAPTGDEIVGRFVTQRV